MATSAVSTQGAQKSMETLCLSTRPFYDHHEKTYESIWVSRSTPTSRRGSSPPPFNILPFYEPSTNPNKLLFAYWPHGATSQCGSNVSPKFLVCGCTLLGVVVEYGQTQCNHIHVALKGSPGGHPFHTSLLISTMDSHTLVWALELG